MPLKRYKRLASLISSDIPQPASALIETMKEGYTVDKFKADALAGVIVGLVAIPLGMALAIATGVAPQYGLYTVVVAGIVVSLLGGSRCQVSGPTAAFVVILSPIVAKFGMSGLLTAGLLAGIILVGMGVLRMGRFIQYVPHPVTTGFTTGIAVVIAIIQIKDFFGLSLPKNPENFFERIQLLASSASTWHPAELAVALSTLLGLILWPKVNKKVPAPVVILTLVTVVVASIKYFFPQLHIATIGNSFSTLINAQVVNGIPQSLPELSWPWMFSGAGGHEAQISVEMIQSLFSSAFAIAMLAAIESLLSAVVADGLVQTQHEPNAELIALGVGNILCPFIGGIPATGAIARTATNIRFGGRSPVAAAVHGLFVLLVICFFAPYVSYLPMAALAALLLIVAYGMSDIKNFKHILKVAPASDAAVLVICFSLTVAFDMVVGVSIGLMLAAMLFLQRMSSLTEGHFILDPSPEPSTAPASLPSGFIVYEIAGPLFFGAAQRAMSSLSAIHSSAKTIIFSLEKVPTMDVTGLVALENAVSRIQASGRQAVFIGVHGQPRTLVEKSETLRSLPVYASLAEATKPTSLPN